MKLHPRFYRSALAMVMLSAAPSVRAAPLVEIGDHIDVFFNGSTSVRYISNIFYSDEDFLVPLPGGGVTNLSEESDTLVVFSPGLEMTIGQPDGNNYVVVLLREDFNEWIDNDELNDNNGHAQLAYIYNDPVLNGKFNASFRETDQNTPDTARIGATAGRLIEREITTVGADVEYVLSPKTSVAGGINYRESKYVSSIIGLFDRSSYSVPLDFYYRYSPKLDLSVGYRFRDTNVKGGADSEDDFFHVGVRGDLLPKLSGRLRVGFQDRDTDIGSTESFSVLSNFTWTATAKTQVRLGLNRDFDTGGTGASIEDTGFNVRVIQSYSEQVRGNLDLSYRYADYKTAAGREDDFFTFGFSLDYAANEYLTFSGGYLYQDNDSNQVGSSFDNNIIHLTASLRY